MNTFCWNVSMDVGKKFRTTWFFVFSIIIFAVCLCMFTCKILRWVNLMVCTDFPNTAQYTMAVAHTEQSTLSSLYKLRVFSTEN